MFEFLLSGDRYYSVTSWSRRKAVIYVCSIFAGFLIVVAFFSYNRPRDRLQNASTISNRRESSCSEIVNLPDLELMMPIPANETGLRELHDWFLPSLALFWPRTSSSPPKLTMLTDKENPNSRQFGEAAQQLAKSIYGSEILVRSFDVKAPFATRGIEKAQWVKFWADNFTSSEFVGFVDSDTLFVTRVTRPDLFIGEKPIVRPIFGKPKALSGFWFNVPGATFKYTGYKEPFTCMSYFPVIVKTAHLKQIREILLKRSFDNRTFDEAMSKMLASGNFSEFNIMCTILWYQFRDEYFWVINEAHYLWKVVAPGQVDNAEEANITAELRNRTRPHVAIHWTYQQLEIDHQVRRLKTVLRTGVCYSMTNSQQHPDYCKNIDDRTASVNKLEFAFEGDDFSSHVAAFEAHTSRIARNEKCPHQWTAASLAVLSDNALSPFFLFDHNNTPTTEIG